MKLEQIEVAAWPSGDCRPIAVLRLEPDELESRIPVVFRDGEDDLDSLKHASLRLATGEQVTLVRHRHAPKAGTDLYADAAADPTRLLEVFLAATGLGGQDVAWQAPAAAQRAQPH